MDDNEQPDADWDPFSDCSASRAASVKRKLHVHRKRLLETTRKIQLMLSGLLVAVAENLPLGILQVPAFFLRAHACARACVHKGDLKRRPNVH